MSGLSIGGKQIIGRSTSIKTLRKFRAEAKRIHRAEKKRKAAEQMLALLHDNPALVLSPAYRSKWSRNLRQIATEVAALAARRAKPLGVPLPKNKIYQEPEREPIDRLAASMFWGTKKESKNAA